MIRVRNFLIFSLICLIFKDTQGRVYGYHGGYGSSFNKNHYEEHDQSVQAGRLSVQQKLGTSANLFDSSSGHVDCDQDSQFRLGTSGHHNLGIGHILNGQSSGSLSSSSLTSSSHGFNSNQYAIPISGGSESYIRERESEKTISSGGSLPVYQAVVPVGGGSQNSYIRSENIVTSGGSLPVYQAVVPVGGSSQNSYIRNEKYVESSRPSQVVYVRPPTLSSNSITHEKIINAQSQSPTIYNPLVYNPTITSSSSQHGFNSKIESSRNVSPVITYQPSITSSSSNLKLEESRSLTNGGTYVLPVNTGSTSVSSSSLHDEQQHSSSSFGDFSTGGFQTGYGSGSSLNEYMSESERLARLQINGANQGGILKGGSILDSQVRGNDLTESRLRTGSGLGLALGSGSGGYKKSAQWESSSKWASGTEIGSDGQPKNYNYLSTGESEHHNINGNQAGFKAATTTVDNNGKVSTYSIHTP